MQDGIVELRHRICNAKEYGMDTTLYSEAPLCSVQLSLRQINHCLLHAEGAVAPSGPAGGCTRRSFDKR